MMNHEVRTMKLNGKILYSEHFKTAEEAYKAYLDIVNEAHKTREKVPKMAPICVRRYNNGDIMCSTFIGLPM